MGKWFYLLILISFFIFGSTPNTALNFKMVAVATEPRMIAWLLIS
nr:MAG TPA: hypothetical protein [Caudoviricetes sp.]DAQ52517.1 MAG TPA: hypothetical protein [Caudoviricetes sp.]